MKERYDRREAASLDNKIKSMEKNKYLAALCALLLGAVYSPLAISGKIPAYQLFSLISIIAFALLIIGAKRISGVLPVAIIYFLLYAATASHLIGSIVILVFTIASLAANELILSRGNVWKMISVFAFLPVSVVAAYFLSGTLLAMIIAAIPFILATLLWIGIKFKKNRKTVIIYLTFGLVLMALIGLACYMLALGKSFTDMREAFISSRDALMNYILSYSVEMNGETVALIGDADLARELFLSASNSLPAVIVIAFITVSYFLYGYQSSMLEKFGGIEYITEDITQIKISAAAAATYLIAFVFSITTDSYGGEPFGSVVCKNLYMILTPALVYAGFTSVRNFIIKKKIRIGFLLLLPLALIAMTGYLLMVLSLVGIICIFAASAREWAEKKD